MKGYILRLAELARPATTNATASAVMVETGGKILVAGVGTYLSSQELALVQYTSDGTLDPTFGVDVIALPMSAAGVPSTGCAVATLSNGTIVAAGQLVDSESHQDLFVSEYTVNSTPTSVYTYDVRNKMVGFSGTTGTASYVYDDSGNRVRETTGGTTSFYLTDTANPTGYAQPIEVWTNTSDTLISATLNTTYLIGDRIFGQDVGGTLAYLLVDGQDNTRLLTSNTGTVSAVFNYDVFGNALNFSLSFASTDVLFQQTFFDHISGLNLYGDATRGAEPGEDFYIEMDEQSFANSSDPISLNLLLLDDADLENGNDPSGHWFSELDDEDEDYTDEGYSSTDQAFGVVQSLEELQDVDQSLETLDEGNSNRPGINLAFAAALNDEGNISEQSGSPINTPWGWTGGPRWNQAVKRVAGGGQLPSIFGHVPTYEIGVRLIIDGGGELVRVEGAHSATGVAAVINYNHINYYTRNGKKGHLGIQALPS
jgi:hypothetical protein